MACFVSNLQLASLVMNEAKIHDVIYDDIQPKTTKKWHWCLYQSVDWRLDKFVGRSGCSAWWASKWDSQVVCNFFCTFNDFPTYGNLSGYSVKGHHACLICEEDTSYVQLKHGRKTVYTQHQCLLKPFHPYRRLKKAFNGSQEHEIALIPLTGQ